jgi:DNA-binding SARP family transcriptional activator/tetratricopeptide (TPR) repeat protein
MTTPSPEQTKGASRASLLGPATLVGPTGRVVVVTRPQVQLVLTYLLWERTPTTQDAIAALLWGDRPLSPHWRGAVRGVLSKVREAIESAGIAAELITQANGTVLLVVPDTLAVDVHEAARALDVGHDRLAAGAAREAADLSEPWVTWMQQPFLAALDGDWPRWAREQAQALARAALVLWTRALREDSRAIDTLPELRRWVAEHPLDEGIQHLLVETLVAEGMRHEALAVHQRLRQVLAAELGLGPAAATTALLEGIDPPPNEGAAPDAGDTAPRRARAEPPLGRLLGRREEVADLERAWRAAADEATPGLVLVQGPSGIGKTRLAAELARQVSRTGATVLWSRCAPWSSSPFEPLARTLAEAPGAGPAARSLRSLLAKDIVTDDPHLARARVLDLAVDALVEGLRGPTLLVIDDLQWADDDNLELLERLVMVPAGALLVIATGRELPERVHALLSRLARDVRLHTVRLGGLTADDLMPLFADQDQRDAATGAAALHDRTGGHPFFVSEIAGMAARDGTPIDIDALPEAARAWIEHRVDALPRPLRSRLELAAVLGPSFRAADLAASAQAPPDEILDQIEALIELGFLVEGAEPEPLAFSHLIAQEAVYQRLGATRRARLHAAAAEGILAASGPGSHAVAAEHFRAAGPDHVDAAAEYFSRAGDDACRRGAWALAEQLQRAALATGGDDPARRAAALIGLGRALHLRGRRDEAEAQLDEAIGLARLHGLPGELAEATLVLTGRAGRGASRHRSEMELVDLLEEALDALDLAPDVGAGSPADRSRLDALQCRVEVELSIALSLWGPIDRRVALASAGVNRARRAEPPDPDLLAATLLGARNAKLGADQIPERLADQEEVLRLDPATRSLEVTLTAHVYRHEDLLRLGDRRRATVELQRASAIADRSGHPFWTWSSATWATLDALISGNLEEAEHRALTAVALQGDDEPGVLACLGVNLVNIRLYQGRSIEVLVLLTQTANDPPEIPCYRAVLALCACEAGAEAQAFDALAPFLDRRFQAIHVDTSLLLTLACLADAVVQLDLGDAVAPLWDLLSPYRGQHVVLNCYGGGGAYWGPVDHQLGRLARAAGRLDEAAALLDEAARSADAFGSPLARARISADQAGTPARR